MLIIGCGYLGRRLGARARAVGASVTGLVRTRESAARLKAAGITPLLGDLDRPPLPSLPSRGRELYYLAPPPARGRTDPRLGNLLEALASSGQPRRIVYLSTTGVYGDCGGDWVDETRPPRPEVERARRRWNAEQRLRVWHAAGHGELVILRVAGIYGPGKLPLQRLRQGLPMVSAADSPWTNRIHADDLVSVCLAAMERGRDGAVYNVSDGHPGTMRDYFDRVADLAGLPRPPLVSLEEAGGRLSAGLLSYLRESRRLDNRRMLEELGVRLRYPDLEAGLPASLDGERNQD